MSKNSRPKLLVLAAAAQILQFFTIGYPQSLDLKIAVHDSVPKIEIEGRILDRERSDRRSLAFIQSYAGIPGIAGRISDMRGVDLNERPVRIKRFIEGEYAAEADLDRWRYDVRLTPFNSDVARAHISWISSGVGILFLNDLIPRALGSEDRSVSLALTLPADWTVSTTEKSIGPGRHNIADREKAVFIISKAGSVRSLAARRADINIQGDWLFSDARLVNAVDAILAEYAKVFNSYGSRPQVTIVHSAAGVPAGAWEADTRGSNVTIVSSDMPFEAQSVQRLHEQLRHELFHVWFPEGVKLTGSYDWFFEGFALYESLRVGVRQNRISFQDMLDSIGQAIRLDSSQNGRGSLIAASADRWKATNSTVYARGMLVAFLSDIAMLKSSNGRRSVEDLIGEIYRDAVAHPVSDGNGLVLAAMRRHTEMVPIIDRHITAAAEIDWVPALLDAGIAFDVHNTAHSLTVAPKPDRRQRVILDKLGYNNWRNLSESSK